MSNTPNQTIFSRLTISGGYLYLDRQYLGAVYHQVLTPPAVPFRSDLYTACIGSQVFTDEAEIGMLDQVAEYLAAHS